MLLLYYPPFRAETDDELLTYALAGLEDYFEDLKEFSADVVSKAWQEVRRAHKTERWPAIKPWRDACLALSAPGAKTQQNSQFQGSSWDERQRQMAEARESQAEAYANEWAMYNSLGQEADRHGWGKFLRRQIRSKAMEFIGSGVQAFDVHLTPEQANDLRREGELFVQRQARREAEGGSWLFGKFYPSQEMPNSGF